MLLDHMSDDGQPQAKSAGLLRLALAEDVEDVRQERRGDPDARVGHFDARLSVGTV